MAEEFRKHTNTGADEDLLKLDLDEEPVPQEDLSVTGTHKSHKKKKNKALYPLLIILLLCVMGYSGYQIAATVIRNLKAEAVYNNIENQFVVEIAPTETEPSPAETSGELTKPVDETEESVALMTVEADPETEPPTTTAAPDPMRLLSVDFTSLKKANSDSVAWLQGLQGYVSYPVVQGKDNSYYLKHLFNGTVNANGTLFVHCDNNFLQDDITYIFGHHMKSGKMFGHLTDYRSRDYYYNNQELRLYTPGKIYTLKPFAVVLGVGTEQITLNYAGAQDFNRGIQGYISRSLHPATVSVSYGDKLVCLCTCSHLQDDGRLFVFCKIMNPGN
ncbi:MAG: class B sortase [Lachnospiraceae bacterium]|nr:class B sortase [Lachnospiraceae bacterium]